MFACFGTTVFAGYTGWQWRRLREIGAELAEAKKQARAAAEAYEASEDAEPSTAVVSAKAEADALVQALNSDLTNLKKANSRDVHYLLGTILLAIGIPFAIEGPVNTYMRAGKLFPGPHLYAGAAVASIWALAAALVPHMQKGKAWARQTHIALNGINVALFAYYQIPTGLEITNKVNPTSAHRVEERSFSHVGNPKHQVSLTPPGQLHHPRYRPAPTTTMTCVAQQMAVPNLGADFGELRRRRGWLRNFLRFPRWTLSRTSSQRAHLALVPVATAHRRVPDICTAQLKITKKCHRW